jgi:DNA-binding transcriptional ArsR family regulator
MTNESVLTQRQADIMEWLRAERSLTIRQLAERFHVTGMTIHRDLDALARNGLARKVRGGVVLVATAPEPDDARPACAMCGKRAPRRTAWVVALEDGTRWHACCSHCGLLQLRHTGRVQSALAPDFLFGQMVNVFQAVYVVGSEVTLCCVPSTLCFASWRDAERYRQGFGGEVMDFAAALATMGEMHHHSADSAASHSPD